MKNNITQIGHYKSRNLKLSQMQISDSIIVGKGDYIYGVTFKDGKQTIVEILVDEEFMKSDYNSKYMCLHFARGYAELWLENFKEPLAEIILNTLRVQQEMLDVLKSRYEKHLLEAQPWLIESLYKTSFDLAIVSIKDSKRDYSHIELMLLEDLKQSNIVENLR